MSGSNEALWLVRRSKGEILGPMSHSDLKKKFMNGGLSSDSEFCPENGYWFSLQEIEELKKYFTPQEITNALRPIERDRSPVEESTQSDLTKPDLSQAMTEKTSSKPDEVTKPLVVEQGQFFGMVFFVGVIGAIFAVIWLIHKLNAAQF